ncbi:DNA alkylation repair protein [Luteimonas sp. TWI1416]|uniref:DNA alkylation repair protein n=1 Tax=unclassified Luteimonas TaxID=2629088 RepID=UPI003208C667
MSASARRTGAIRASDIPVEVLEALSLGALPSATLAEGLAVDQARLLRTVFPRLPPHALTNADAACRLGILKRMRAIAQVLLQALGPAGIADCQAHASDTVRGWACFMIGQQPDIDLPRRLEAIRPLADDLHFGVREWAWMAVRPQLAQDLNAAIAQLTPWTASPSERLRRFASEALRPRGVWCAHIPALKQQPQIALPLLEPLRADPATYVQDSVANWLNDAAKDRPDWVRGLCTRWRQGQPTEATRRICTRALRSLD